MTPAELNEFVSRLTVAEIEALTDEQVTALAIERPGHPGQFGFMLNPTFFRSNEHFNQTMSALVNRLRRALLARKTVH